MATQLLIYETATPVSQRRHGDWSIDAGKDYSFSRKVNSVPLMAVEIPNAAAEYPLVFGGTGDTVLPAAILGLRAGENLYLDDGGAWRAKYLPAFVRRYPFVFSSADEGKTFTLCIDESFSGFNQRGLGEPLFTAEGKPTPFVDNTLKFLQQYQLEFSRTQAFCKKLKDLNLLEPMQAQVSFDSGEKMLLSGFSVVDRARLKTLSSEALADLAKSDELELIYAHLLSMRNFAAMKDRLAKPVSGQNADNTATQDTGAGMGSDAKPEEVQSRAGKTMAGAGSGKKR
jgi:hypothetical protein